MSEKDKSDFKNAEKEIEAMSIPLSQTLTERYALPVRSVGVQGDFRTYRFPAVLSFETLAGGFYRTPEDWDALEAASSYITNKASFINRTLILLYRKPGVKLALQKGYCDKGRLDRLREADAIAIEGLYESGWYDKVFQHLTIALPYASSPDRFADFPVKVASLSRFNNSKATKAALEGMADGTVDIVIGTHKLVQDDIKFKNLGLVIIDEEHRFGVRQKEQLKRLRANVDILTMTATPIPRTLSMALEGLRDFSLITTAPSRRLAVKTFVKPFSEGSVREAVLRELKRGGQVFFLHNEVDTIENMRERLETLLPEARIGVAHGQLRERELEQVMRDFLQQRFNVLLCSTIIETGIDIPNANTIIINRADKFGLAQLHQLRGRVGRSHHQAYAYLLTPEYITKDAEKRLDAIAAADELGAGFTLAMQDLEIRGAGEILGEGQSGEMIQVGFTLYTEMLKQAVRDLKKGRQPDLDAPLGITTEIKLHSPALLPESYCPDIHERLVLYKRLAVCETVQQINAIHEELVDRFGLPEQPVKTLIESHHLRLAAKELGIDAIDATSESVTITFGKHHQIDPTEIILLIQSDRNYRLAGADKLKFTAQMEDVETRIKTVKSVLKTLKERVAAK